MTASERARAWVPAGLLAGAIVLASLIPVTLGQAVLAPLPLALLIGLSGCGGLALALAAAVTARAERHELAPCLEAIALWSACGLAVLVAAASVAVTAEAMDLENIVLAQKNTALYLVKQPLAAWIYVVAITLSAHESCLRVMLGPPSRPRAAVLVMVTAVLSALGATLFLGGFAGEGAPGPVWLGGKTLLVALALVALRRLLRSVPRDARMSIGWAAAAAGLLNLVVSFIQALR